MKQAAVALTALGIPSVFSRAVFGQAKPAAQQPAGVAFDHAWLRRKAKTLSGKAYVPPPRELPAALVQRVWDQFHFRPERALWADKGLRFRAQFFHRSMLFQERVHLFEVVNGRARPISYDPGMFDYAKSGLRAEDMPRDLGVAGFRLTFDADKARDVTAFLGASYFRAVGGDHQYGLSARGLAIDSGMKRPEEFPLFRCFWLERPAAGSGTLVVHALLDSPSTTGAYRFAISPGATQVMDVDVSLYPRKRIERLGIAPGTSMFQCGENDRRMGYDARPEIHDSDGLAIWTGRGEWIWRPLTNPSELAWNAFVDEHPKGFGLMQRDRMFESYQDDHIFYERRPSLWVEPKGNWGRGSVQLIEIPTNDETNDNIVSFWCPERPPEAGEELTLGYRLHWGGKLPFGPTLARTSATRLGLGGVVGRPRSYYACRFMVDFAIDTPAPAALRGPIEPVVQASRGRVELASARLLHVSVGQADAATHGYRAVFDVVPPDASEAPIELRLFLRAGGQPLTETWLYQWRPPPPAQRTLY